MSLNSTIPTETKDVYSRWRRESQHLTLASLFIHCSYLVSPAFSYSFISSSCPLFSCLITNFPPHTRFFQCVGSLLHHFLLQDLHLIYKWRKEGRKVNVILFPEPKVFCLHFLQFRINFTVISGGPGGILDQFYNHWFFSWNRWRNVSVALYSSKCGTLKLRLDLILKATVWHNSLRCLMVQYF